MLVLTQIVSPLNVRHHEETQSHEHNQGPQDLQGQEPTDRGLLVGSVCVIQRLLLPVWATAGDPDAQYADEHAAGQKEKSKDEALGKLAALSADEGSVRVRLVAAKAPLAELTQCPGAGQDHSRQPHHGTCRPDDLQHRAAVREGFVLACLEPEDGEQDPHKQQDGAEDEKEENEHADMPVLLGPAWFAGCGRHGQERPLPQGGVGCVPLPPAVSTALQI